MARLQGSSKLPAAHVSARLRIAAIVLRTAFICLLILVTLAVSRPQSETIWSSYETPGDLIRLILGIAVCLWLVFELFRGPKDDSGYRTWFFLGLAAVPFALVCLLAIW